MKRIVLTLTVTFLICSGAFAQKFNPAKLPLEVKQTFAQKFPNAEKVTWQLEKEFVYIASFVLNGEEISARINQKGTWLESIIKIKAAELPDGVMKSVKNEFSEYSIRESSKIEVPDKDIIYKVELYKGDETIYVFYSTDGKIIEKKVTNISN